MIIALFVKLGFRDLCEIGDGSRPKLFDLNIRKPQVLFDQVVEIEERVTMENYELDPFPHPELDESDPALVKTSSGEVIRILQPIDVEATRQQLRKLREAGFMSIAVCFMHSHIFPGTSLISLLDIEKRQERWSRTQLLL